MLCFVFLLSFSPQYYDFETGKEKRHLSQHTWISSLLHDRPTERELNKLFVLVNFIDAQRERIKKMSSVCSFLFCFWPAVTISYDQIWQPCIRLLFWKRPPRYGTIKIQSRKSGGRLEESEWEKRKEEEIKRNGKVQQQKTVCCLRSSCVISMDVTDKNGGRRTRKARTIKGLSIRRPRRWEREKNMCRLFFYIVREWQKCQTALNEGTKDLLNLQHDTVSHLNGPKTKERAPCVFYKTRD